MRKIISIAVAIMILCAAVIIPASADTESLLNMTGSQMFSNAKNIDLSNENWDSGIFSFSNDSFSDNKNGFSLSCLPKRTTLNASHRVNVKLTDTLYFEKGLEYKFSFDFGSVCRLYRVGQGISFEYSIPFSAAIQLSLRNSNDLVSNLYYMRINQLEKSSVLEFSFIPDKNISFDTLGIDFRVFSVGLAQGETIIPQYRVCFDSFKIAESFKMGEQPDMKGDIDKIQGAGDKAGEINGIIQDSGVDADSVKDSVDEGQKLIADPEYQKSIVIVNKIFGGVLDALPELKTLALFSLAFGLGMFFLGRKLRG